MFTIRDDYHSHFEDNLERFLIDDVRHYRKEGSSVAYPSVTSVLSFINGPKFAEWRRRVGEEAANKKTKHATTRGTRLHTLFEHHLNNEEVSTLKEYKVPLVNLMFNSMPSHPWRSTLPTSTNKRPRCHLTVCVLPVLLTLFVIGTANLPSLISRPQRRLSPKPGWRVTLFNSLLLGNVR